MDTYPHAGVFQKYFRGAAYIHAYIHTYTKQHKVWFRPGSGLVLLPSIHAVDVYSDGVTHLDVHENDAYYNHYRTKSRTDHQHDPLRSNMVCIGLFCCVIGLF